MIQFKILKKSRNSRARLGQLITLYGVIETPCLVPVATQAVIKTLDSREVKETKSQLLIANTFHLHLKPGEKIVKSAGGLHKFMNWQGGLMTDSGGFQVFSLGFGKDFGTGKILKNGQPAQNASRIEAGEQPKLIKITDSGVYFNSPFGGEKLFLGPKESIKIQEDLGADIIFAFDECTSPLADYKYTKKSLLKTHQWAKVCLAAKKSKQALFGIVQGGRYKDLRIESAKFIGKLPFDGFGIGGEFGDDKRKMSEMLRWVIEELPEEKPRHLLGIGYLEDIPKIIKAGVDTFDCIVPTHYARRGRAFTSQGELDLRKSLFFKDKKPLDKNCSCFVCQNYKRNYISHLLRAREITALKLLTFHNLYFFNIFIEKIRMEIKKGRC
jgi:queuine tRNA-ribosyltransferase/7-cyano-7-deazaguanine tRNA-ribosyltransferase